MLLQCWAIGGWLDRDWERSLAILELHAARGLVVEWRGACSRLSGRL